jgi:hypothetical protein
MDRMDCMDRLHVHLVHEVHGPTRGMRFASQHATPADCPRMLSHAFAPISFLAILIPISVSPLPISATIALSVVCFAAVAWVLVQSRRPR